MRFPLLLLTAMIGLARAQDAEIMSENVRRPILHWNGGASRAQAHAHARTAEPATAYHWAAFTASLGEPERALLAGFGVEVLGFAGRPGGLRLYKVRVNGNASDAIASLGSLPTFVNLLPLLPEEKITAKVRRGEFRSRRAQDKVQATVSFHRSLGRAAMESLLKGAVDEVLPATNAGSVHVVASPKRIQALAGFDEVSRVEDYQEPQPLMDRARDQSQVGALQYGVLDTLAFPPTPAWNSGAAYSGDSIWISVNEQVADSIRDLREAVPGGTVRRSTNKSVWSQSGTTLHGTFVAAIAAGNGWNGEYTGHGRYRMRGVAPKALLTGGYGDGDVNNYSTVSSSNGFYTPYDADIDARLSSHVGVSVEANNAEVWAAGNNGAMTGYYGAQRGYYSLLINAKNAIKVASTETDSKRATSSSMGPTRDGRLGPDVSAPGSNITSAASGFQGYRTDGGTSFAAPHVTGIVALMLQKYRDQVLRPRGLGSNIHDHPLWNSTLRAILIHTASDMVNMSGIGEGNADYAANGYPDVAALYPQGPDFPTGYGRADALKALQFTDPAHFRESVIGQGQVHTYSITVPAGRTRLRASLVWDDPAMTAYDEATAYESKLVNDLDLRLIDPSGNVHIVHAPDHSLYNNGTVPADGIDPVTPADDWSPSTLTPWRDSVSNVEVKDILDPQAGVWRIEVRGYDIALDQSADRGVNQDYSLVSDISLPAAPAVNGPDLVVSKLISLPARPVMGQETHLVATLHNRGNQASPAVAHSVSFYADGSEMDATAYHAQSLAPGQSVLVPTRVPFVLQEGYQGSARDFAAMADASDIIAESSEQNNTLTLANVEDYLPQPWVAEDIGSAPSPGVSTFKAQRSFRLESYGAGIGGTADAFRFVHRPLNGNGEIRAHLGQVYASGAARSGLMIRESTAPGSRFAMISLSYPGTAAFLRRSAAGGAATSVTSASGYEMHARLVRAGDVFTAYVSPNGVDWTLAGSATISMGAYTRIGIAMSGHPGALPYISGMSTLSQVQVTGGATATLKGKFINAAGAGVAGISVNVTGCATPGMVSTASGEFNFPGLPLGGTCIVTPISTSYVIHPSSLRFPDWDSDREALFLATPISLPSPWATADIGAPGGSSGAGQNAGFFTLRGGGADISGTADAYRSAHQSLSGDGEIRARVDALSPTDPWAKAGVMMREGLAANARNAFMAITPAQGATFQNRAATGGTTAFTSSGGYAAPYWVRLVRAGNVFTGYRSPDGAVWTQQGQATLAMPAALNVGLAVTSHNTLATASGTFSDVTVSSLAFTEADIGSTGLAGSRTASGDAHSVKGSGADIWGNADAFHFSHLALAGDGEIRARVASVQNTDGWAKAGVMIRETLAANSRNFMVAVTPSQGATFQRRLTAGGSSVGTFQAGITAPRWVRIVRAGNLISAFISANGLAWTLMGQETVALSANVYIGLAVTAHNNGLLATGVFDGVRR